MDSIYESGAAHLTRRREIQIEEQYRIPNQRNQRRLSVQKTRSYVTRNTTSARISTTVRDYISDGPHTPIGNIRQPIFTEHDKKEIVIEERNDEPLAKTNNILRLLTSGRNMTTTNNVDKDGIRNPETEESMSYIQENEDDVRNVPLQKYQ